MKQGTHTRFTDATVTVPSPTLAAQAKIQARENAGQGEADENGEGDLEVFDMSAEGMVTTRTVKNEKGKGKGKGKEKERTELPVGKKRRRGMDPWAGVQGFVLYPSSHVDVYTKATTRPTVTPTSLPMHYRASLGVNWPKMTMVCLDILILVRSVLMCYLLQEKWEWPG